MKRLSVFASALLYTALAVFANPGLAQTLTSEQRDEISALRAGDMRKLVIHEEPVAVGAAEFTDFDGESHVITDWNGRVRLVNFWATWCAPCRTEKPSLDQLEAELSGPDFEVIAIATGRNAPQAIHEFNDEVGIVALTTYLDPKSKLAGEMRVPGLPVTVLVNREGMEIGRLMGGADWTSESARAIIGYLTDLPTS
ncbi:TlpA family protein disulfide reductase [Amaricoccus macauensis]|uniref:TlpA family protein disulfide reductase n=1 Tax=Amaricoccus macauensis TaxID=57001 RepID=UPI003C7ABAB9